MKTTVFNKAKTAYKTVLPQAKGYVKPASKLAKAGKFAKLGGAVVGGAIGAYEIAKNTPKIISGVKDLNKNYGYVRKSRKKSKEMKKQLVNKRAERNYGEVYGKEKLFKAKDKDRFYNKDRRSLNKMKKNINKNVYGYLD